MTKKISKQEKAQRRKMEILKAQAKSGSRGQYVMEKEAAPLVGPTDAKQPKKLTQRLHVDIIKTDLIKTALFAVFVIILLVVLRASGLQLDLSIYK